MTDVRSTFFGDFDSSATRLQSGPAVAEQDIVVEPLSASQWRVSDGRWPDRDGRSLLGFIEITSNGGFEVMSLPRGFEWFTYASLAEATAHFSQTGPEDNQLSRFQSRLE